MRAIVCFSDSGLRRAEAASAAQAGGHPLGRFLKRGFRHCFVVVLSGESWFLIDGCNGVPALRYIARADFDLAAFYRAQGLTAVETVQRAAPLRAPFVVNNCVGLVKAVLALRAPFALTPYALHRHLMKEQRR
jgi:hypothetical protein